MLSHHVVIRNGKIANYHPYPPTPWNGSVRDVYGTPGPYEDAVQNTPIFEENGPDNFKGIDIMRAVRSFDPCLPCGVHMYLGNGKVVETHHSPFFGNHRTQGGDVECEGRSSTVGSRPSTSWSSDSRRRADPAARAAAQELVRTLMELHGAALERMLGMIHEAGGPADGLIDQFGDDELVGSLLLLYGLHPVDLETRVRQALEKTRPYLRSHGGNVELAGVDRPVSCGSGCRGAVTDVRRRP